MDRVADLRLEAVAARALDEVVLGIGKYLSCYRMSTSIVIFWAKVRKRNGWIKRRIRCLTLNYIVIIQLTKRIINHVQICRQYGLNAVSDTRVIHNEARKKNIVLPCQDKLQRYLRIFFLAEISSPLLYPYIRKYRKRYEGT